MARGASGTIITTVTGADAGEGLIFNTSYPYAYAVTTTFQPSLTFNQGNGPVTFTRIDQTPGVGFSGTTYYFGSPIAYGATANDDNLESVGQQVRYGNNMSLTFSNLTVNGRYELQLFLQEPFFTADPGIGSRRVWNINTNGAPFVTSFDYFAAGGSPAGTGASTGIVIRTFLYPTTSTLTLGIGGTGNPFFNAVTLQAIPEPSTLLLFTGGGWGFWYWRRRARRQP